MSFCTIIGGKGFIGSAVAKKFEENTYKVWIPEKDDPEVFEKELGIVIYCAGYGDCSNNPLKVIDSNVTFLSKLVEKGKYKRLVYLSSTRVYMNQYDSSEHSDLTITDIDKRKLFNLTKLVAEEICLLSEKDNVIVRPSNVYGAALNSPLYLPSIVRNAINDSYVDMYVSPNYNKDYVSVEDVAYAIYSLAVKKSLSYPVYNIASGQNVSSREIATLLEKSTDCKINWHDVEYESEEKFPITNIERLVEEIEFNARSVLDDLPKMVDEFKKQLEPISE